MGQNPDPSACETAPHLLLRPPLLFCTCLWRCPVRLGTWETSVTPHRSVKVKVKVRARQTWRLLRAWPWAAGGCLLPESSRGGRQALLVSSYERTNPVHGAPPSDLVTPRGLPQHHDTGVRVSNTGLGRTQTSNTWTGQDTAALTTRSGTAGLPSGKDGESLACYHGVHQLSGR